MTFRRKVITFLEPVADGDLLQKQGDKLASAGASGSPVLHQLNSFSNDAGISELGETVNNFNLTWTYNRNSDNPTSQSIDNGVGSVPVGDRSVAVTGAGITSNTNYTISAIGDDSNPSNRSTTIRIQSKRYWGVANTILTTDAEVLAQLGFEEFATNRQKTINYDASGGGGNNYLYFCYPTSFGLPSSTLFNDFPFTAYTVATISNFTNASGGVTDYYLIRSNNQFSGSNLKWQFL